MRYALCQVDKIDAKLPLRRTMHLDGLMLCDPIHNLPIALINFGDTIAQRMVVDSALA
jgi:hypothetical protein